MPVLAEANVENSAIRSVAVIGAGDRGRAFALRCAAQGLSTVLQDVLSSKLRKVEDVLAHGPTVVREHLQLANSIEDAVRDADLAIDFVPDELESKLEIFSLLDRMAPPKTIFCTPTQLSISDLGSCTYRADRCIAVSEIVDQLPAHIRVIKGTQTTPQVANAVSTWLDSLGYTTDMLEEASALASTKG